MEVFSKAFPKTLSGLVIGVGVALAAPVLLVAAASLLQPLAKTALKGGFIMRDTALGLYGATGARLAALSPPEPEAKAASVAEPPKPEKKAKPGKTKTEKTKKS